MSRIGKKPIAVPEGVKIEVKEGSVFVEGPKGKASCTPHQRVSVSVKDGRVLVSRRGQSKQDKALHGLWRALILNMVKGVTQGYTRELELIGVGYKAAAQGGFLNLQLGYSHPVNFAVPEGIKIESPKPTQIIVRGIDKELVGRVAKEIREICPPEPYKGKGIRFAGEYIKKKVGKAAQTATK
jgi:large subunit ribosomal protein L6